MNKPSFVGAQALLMAGAVAVAVGVSSCGGGGAEGGCPATVSCGNEPTGYWNVQSTCQYLPTQPSQPLNYNDYVNRPPNPVVASIQPLPSTNGDWCSNLDYPPGGGIGEVVLWHPAAQLTSGNLWFKTDNTYVMHLQFSTPASTHFSLACLEGEGVNPTCGQFQTDLTAFYAMSSSQSQGIKGIQCADGSPDGCDCNYTFEVDLADEGTWAAGGGTVSMNSEPPNYTFNGAFIPEYEPPVPVNATYCNSGSLTLTGTDGTSLAGILGLRTLTMAPGQAPAPTGDGGM